MCKTLCDLLLTSILRRQVLSLISDHPEAKVLANLELRSYNFQIAVTTFAMIGLLQGFAS